MQSSKEEATIKDVLLEAPKSDWRDWRRKEVESRVIQIEDVSQENSAALVITGEICARKWFTEVMHTSYNVFSYKGEKKSKYL